MLLDAFHSNDPGITEQMHGGIFNLRRLTAKSKITELLARDLLCADDCALAAHSLEDAQTFTDCFARAAKRFPLTLSIKKTEVLRQLQPSTSPVDKFCYLGSIISSDGSLDGEISQRIAKASAAFGQLRIRLWNEDGVHLRTKIDVYRAVALSILL